MTLKQIMNELNEGKDKLIPYIVRYTYISFTEKRRKTGSVQWPDELGRPTLEKLKKFRTDFNASMNSGGANSHLSSTNSPIGTVSVINQRSGKELFKYTPPPFETI